MPNILIHKQDGTILNCITNARRIKNTIKGDNGGFSSKNLGTTLLVKWIDEVATEIWEDVFDEMQQETIRTFKGYVENAADLTEAIEVGPEIDIVDPEQLRRAMKLRTKIAGLTSQQVENYVRNKCATLPAGQEEFIDMLVNISQVLHAHIRVSDYHRE